MRGRPGICLRPARAMGFKVEVVPTERTRSSSAERAGDPSWPHVLIYGHYDVQPADPLDLWKTPPFDRHDRRRPDLRPGRRRQQRAAPDQHRRGGRLLEENPGLPLRITFLIEGEEEMGSPSFAGLPRKHQGRLRAGGLRLPLRHRAARPRTGRDHLRPARAGPVRSARDRPEEATCTPGCTAGCCAIRSRRWRRFCATLHLPDGRVNVPGFYDEVLEVEPWERAELKKLGVDERPTPHFSGSTPLHPARLFAAEAIRFQPTLEFNGIGGGYQGEGTKTVIPSRAFAKISCRLVPNQRPARSSAWSWTPSGPARPRA